MTLDAGLARSIITPPVGLPMDGFIGRGSAQATHDDLTLSALFLRSNSGSGVVYVAADLVSLSAATTTAVREILAERLGQPPHLLLGCSHTHYGPAADPDSALPLTVLETSSLQYIEGLRHAIADTIVSAIESARPARLAYGKSSAAIGVNRREELPDGRIIIGVNPDGPVDPRVDVLRVDSVDGSPIAAVFNHACHAVSLGGQCRDWSADFVGPAREAIELATGAVSLFMQGAAGDINPILFSYDWAHPLQLGATLAGAAIEAYRSATPLERPATVLPLSAQVALPRLRPAVASEAQQHVTSLSREIAAHPGPSDNRELLWLQVRLRRAHEMLGILDGTEPEYLDVELDVVALDSSTAIITAPAEVFTEVAAAIRARSPFAQLLYSGYTNGSIYYLPTRAAHAQGGYEVTHACLVAPDAADVLIEQSVKLLQAAHAAIMR